MPTSVRLDPDSERLLDALVRGSGRSKSEIIREALRTLDAQMTAAPADDLHGALSDLIGIDDQPDEPDAIHHKRTYRERLAARHERT